MICGKPFRNAGSELPCGKCQPCLINKRNTWTTRLLLEDTQHDKSCFITLTYNDENLPNELRKKDCQKWLKRVRKSYHPSKIRYYICGEYGENTQRPHYHAVLYGISFNYQGLAELLKIKHLNLYPPPVIEMLKLWGKGNIHFEKTGPGQLTYACSHITKTIASITDDTIQAPFHAMSQGLGKNAMLAITSWLSTEEGIRHYYKENDVPHVVRINNKLRPIGKYLRNIIRRQLALEEKTPENAIKRRGLEELAKKLDNPHYKSEQRTKDSAKARQIIQHQHTKGTL